MSDKMNEVIKDIAVRHGVVLSKDDPVLILQTMNERLLEENRKAQQEMLAQFKEEMENISSHWKDNAKEKAEKILNAALNKSKAMLNEILISAASQHSDLVKAEITKSVAEIRQLNNETKTISKFNLIACTCILIASGIIAVFVLWV